MAAAMARMTLRWCISHVPLMSFSTDSRSAYLYSTESTWIGRRREAPLEKILIKHWSWVHSPFYFRSHFCKSTTCDLSADEILSNESTLDSSKATTMNRMRPGSTRRFSLIKLELPASDPNSSTTGSNRSSNLAPMVVALLRLPRWFQKFSSIGQSQSSAEVTLSSIQSQDSSLFHGHLRRSPSCAMYRQRRLPL